MIYINSVSLLSPAVSAVSCSVVRLSSIKFKFAFLLSPITPPFLHVDQQPSVFLSCFLAYLTTLSSCKLRIILWSLKLKWRWEGKPLVVYFKVPWRRCICMSRLDKTKEKFNQSSQLLIRIGVQDLPNMKQQFQPLNWLKLNLSVCLINNHAVTALEEGKSRLQT